MRHRHGNGAQPDDLTYAESLGEQPHRCDEPLPPQVRFHAGEQKERRADGVVQRVEVQFRVVVVREVVGLERHQRSTRPVVQ
jgi:hypothetical protein